MYINNVLYKYEGNIGESFTVRSNTVSISPSAFSNQPNLTTLSIPGSVKNIGARAFERCSKLSSVTLSEGVEMIGYQAFSNCPSLQSITLPASIKEVEHWAFDKCTNLTKIYCKMITPSSKFYIPTEVKDIYVPHIAVEDYKAAWSEYADKIKGYSF